MDGLPFSTAVPRGSAFGFSCYPKAEQISAAPCSAAFQNLSGSREEPTCPRHHVLWCLFFTNLKTPRTLYTYHMLGPNLPLYGSTALSAVCELCLGLHRYKLWLLLSLEAQLLSWRSVFLGYLITWMAFGCSLICLSFLSGHFYALESLGEAL